LPFASRRAPSKTRFGGEVVCVANWKNRTKTLHFFFIPKRAKRAFKTNTSRGEGCPISGTEAVAVAGEGEGEGEGISKARINLEKTSWELISVWSSRCGN